MTNKPEALTLLPCPFCGKKVHFALTKKRRCQLHGDVLQNTVIACCYARVEKGSRELAAETWNTRAKLADPQA